MACTFSDMRRCCVSRSPYGLLSSGPAAGRWAALPGAFDRGYGHFTTRQNIQYNWPKLAEVPDILAELATVEMHAIQTSGNCIRNVTSDHLAGITPNELEDPRPWCEIIRQVVDVPSRVHVSSAQVQDRGDGSAAGSRRFAGA